jgi:hypothetical protein
MYMMRWAVIVGRWEWWALLVALWIITIVTLPFAYSGSLSQGMLIGILDFVTLFFTVFILISKPLAWITRKLSKSKPQKSQKRHK